MKSKWLAALLSGLLLLAFVAGTSAAFAQSTEGGAEATPPAKSLISGKKIGLTATAIALAAIAVGGIGWAVFAKRGPARE
ncbi:MAG: hypothetical protein HY261_01375 [Chloroflexi bacterium]|nr:hypothetical protein [Chloroflexota bacterium]